MFTFAPYILTKLTDFLQTKRDMCLRGLVWAWAAKPSWDLSTGCYWAIFDTTVQFSFVIFIDSYLISVSISNSLSYSPQTFTKSQSWTPNSFPQSEQVFAALIFSIKAMEIFWCQIYQIFKVWAFQNSANQIWQILIVQRDVSDL